MVDMRVDLSGVILDNPIIPASGTFGYGQEFAKLYDINILGSFSFKGTTPLARFGNQQPRIAETPKGMINSVGLENPGIEYVTDQILPRLPEIFNKPVIGNISGFSVEDYVTCAKALDGQDQVAILEVNISCPNVHGGGLAFGQDPREAAKVTAAVKAVTSKPVYIKLSPNVTDVVEIAKACEDSGADGISLINTLLAMRIDIKKRRPILDNVMGGLSGPAVFPVALRMVYQVAKGVNVPVIGMGGIENASQVIEMIMAGATAVEIGAANLVNPWVCKEIIEELPVLMEELGISSFEEIRGVI